MRTLILLITLMLTLSCCSERKNKLSTRTIALINNAGTVTIDLINEFDTTHTWKRNADYKCGAQQHYRIQSSEFSMDEPAQPLASDADSMFGLTITHNFYPECNKQDIEFEPDSALMEIQNNYAMMKGNFNTKFNILKNENINGLRFVLYAVIDTTYEKIIEQRLCAATHYKSTYISFDFLKSSTHLHDTMFVWDSYAMLKTVKIK